jgi:ferric-dicitrate binding protein FerR (iron transport regulator)
MVKTDKAKSALPYARRLLEDEYVQEQLRSAAVALRNAYGRARRERADATEDKRLYGHVREAATSLRKATNALQRPKPAPKKRRLRKAATLAFAIGGSAWLAAKLQSRQSAASQPGQPAAQAETFPPGSQASHPTGTQQQTTVATP